MPINTETVLTLRSLKDLKFVLKSFLKLADDYSVSQAGLRTSLPLTTYLGHTMLINRELQAFFAS
jgi:hypothetical protein